MNAKLKMAFGSYFIAALLILLIGLVYSTRTEVMPYHLEVLGMSWGEIQPQVQFMLLAFLHGGGAGALANGAALMFLLFVPFVVIDLVVASVLMSMGMMMLSPMMISLPFKIMMFVLIDGWALVLGTLAGSFYT